MKKATFEDLLNSLQSSRKSPSLDNTKENWSKLHDRKAISEEIGLEGSELDEFLKNWTKENQYNNI